MNVAVLDLETSKKPIMFPWQTDAYLSTIGLRMYLDDGGTYYKEWVWYHNERPNITQEDRLQIVFEIQEEIDKLGKNDLLVGHNFKFDADWLKWYNVDTSGCTMWCTAIADYMLNGQEKIGYKLGECCERRGLPVKTDVVKTYWDAGRNTHEVPLKTLLRYQKNDVDITATLFKQQYIDLKKNAAMFRLAQVRQRCLHPITDIEINGMPFDYELAKQHVAHFTAELETTDAELRTLMGGDINFRSGPELSAGLFGGKIKRVRYVPRVYDRWITYKEPYKYTYKSGKRKGQVVTKFKTRRLREITCTRQKEEYEIPVKGAGFKPDPKSEGKDRDGNPNGVYKTNKGVLKNLVCGKTGGTTVQHKKRILELLVHRSKIGKFTETFVGANEGTGLFHNVSLNSDGKAHPSYNQTIAATGRFTSSNPNGQNFPRSKEDEDGFTNPLKSIFIPSRDDGLILAIDLSQLEWRVAAWLSQDPVAMREILDGVDCHLDNAVKFFGDAKYRQAAKIMTFRLLYGGSAYAFYMDPLMPDFSLKKWNEIVDQYRRKYIVLTQWQERNKTAVSQNEGWLHTATGRSYKIPMEEHKKFPGVMVYKETCIKNYPVQGTATGDIVPLAMDLMWDDMDKTPQQYMSTNWFGQVHDSVLFDTMPHEVKRMAMLGIKTFERLPAMIEQIWGCKFNLPLTGEAEWGPNYANLNTSVKHEEGQWILKTK